MRSPAIVAAAACLTLLVTDVAHAATAIADPGRVEVSRRVDPSLDPFLKTELVKTPLSEMTTDQQWIATHARPLVVHDSDPSVSLNLTGWAGKPQVAVYYNATGVNPYRATQIRQTRKWMLKRGKKQVMVDGWRALDLRKSAARKWWLYGSDGKATCHPDRDQRAALDLYACGYTALWLDNALTTPKQGFSPTPKVSQKSWARGVLSLLKTLKKKKPKGTTFTINTHWTDTNFGYAKRPKLSKKDPAIRAARYADQVIIEGGAIDPGLHYALSAKQPWSYPRLLKFADAMHKAKVKLQWEKTGSSDLMRNRTPISGSPKLPSIPECRDSALSAPWVEGDASWKAHVQSAAFNYASALVTYKRGDSVGDMCEYPGRGWRGYEADLGNPASRRYTRGGFTMRKFQKGFVAINPSDSAKRFTLPSGRTGLDLGATTWPISETPARSFIVSPRSAAVVSYQ